jgi:hypothetical protein
MFDLAPHLIHEAMEIAHKMAVLGEQIIAIRETGFFVVNNVNNNSLVLHRFTFRGSVYFIVQDC